MSEKGTLCHAMTRWETVCGDFPPTWAGIGRGSGGEGEIRGLEGREKAFVVFLSGNT